MPFLRIIFNFLRLLRTASLVTGENFRYLRKIIGMLFCARLKFYSPTKECKSIRRNPR